MSSRMRAAVASLLCAGLQAAHAAPVMTVAVDPRIELLAVIHILASERDPSLADLPGDSDILSIADLAREEAGTGHPQPGRRQGGRAYAGEILDRFGSMRGHAAVRAYRLARRRGVPSAELCFRLLEAGDLTDLRGRGPEALPELLEAFTAFAREGRFQEFFDAHRPLYRDLSDALRLEIRGRDYAALFEEYAGTEATARYHWIVSPIARPSGFNRVVAGAPYQVYALMGPQLWDAGRPRFDYARQQLRVWHELAHTLLDPLADEHPDRLKQTEALFEPIRHHCRGVWSRCVAEHAALGTAYRIWRWAGETGRTKGMGDPPAPPARESLPYLSAIEQSLREYEQSRDRFATLKDFYPRLLDAFQGLAARAKEGGERRLSDP